MFHWSKNNEAIIPACRKRRLIGTHQLAVLTVNGGDCQLNCWWDHSCQILRLGVSKGMLPVKNVAPLNPHENEVNPANSVEGTKPDKN